MADVKISADDLERHAADAEVWAGCHPKGAAIRETYERSVALHRLAALALRAHETRIAFLTADEERITDDELLSLCVAKDKAATALNAYCIKLTRPSAAKEDGCPS